MDRCQRRFRARQAAIYGATVAVDGLAVSFPASVPEITAVGGTEFNEGNGNYWSSANGCQWRLGSGLHSGDGVERHNCLERV